MIAVRAVTESHPEDLSNVLRRVVQRSLPVTAAARRELANDRVTKEFLEAGLRLLTGQHGEVVDVDEGDARQRPFFDWLSVKRVVGETNRDNTRVTANQHRHRWPSRDDYIEDLLAYSLWEGHWLTTNSLSDENIERLLTGDFAMAIHEITQHVVHDVNEGMAFRVGMIAAGMAKDDPLILGASAKTYQKIMANWSRLYQRMLEARSVTLREGMTLEEFTVILTALVDGIAMRVVADPEVLDEEKRRSLLGKGVLAVIAASFDPGDGRSLDDLVRLVENGREEEAPDAGEGAEGRPSATPP